MKKKHEDFYDLLFRLKAADPAKFVESKIGENVIMNATKTKSETNRWKVPTFTLMSGVATASVVTLMVGINLPTATMDNPQVLLSLGGQAQESGNMLDEGKLAPGATGDDTPQSDSMFWDPYNYVYSPGDSLSKDTSQGNAYKFTLAGDGTPEFKALTKWFGVNGDPVKNPYDYDENHFFIGDVDNYNTESLNLYWSNLGSWYYSNPMMQEESNVNCSKDEALGEELKPDNIAQEDSISESDLNGGRIEACYSDPKPPVDLPTIGKAKDTAYELFSAMGIDINVSEIKIYQDEWSVSASYALMVEGEKTSVSFDVYWTGKEITYASGSFARPVLIQKVDMVSPYSAVSRIEDYRWWGSYYQDPSDYSIGFAQSMEDSSPMVDTPNNTGEIDGENIQEELIEPTIETVEVAFDSAEQKLLMVWSQTGDVWLLPGYVYQTENGKYYGSPSVVGVEDSLVDLSLGD
jgi:hypothetical protein